jgi:2'-5' RNA ligase
MRVFIAINTNEEIRRGLADLQAELQSKVDIKKSEVKWVNPKNIHLTLKFLGEIKDKDIVEVCNITKDAAGRHKVFQLYVESVGFFGSKSARVLWIGTGKGSENLLELQKDLEQQFDSAGWPAEKRQFSGHLTLCRIRNPKAGLKLAQITEGYRDFKLGSVLADSATVYQSQLTPSGPVYTVLGNYKMREA